MLTTIGHTGLESPSHTFGFWSTSPTLNELHAANLRPSIIRSHEVDVNRDGKNERIEVNVEVPLIQSESITSVETLIFHETLLHDKGRYQFDSLTHVRVTSPEPMHEVWSDGRLLLRQAWPMYCRGGYMLPYADDPLLDLSALALARPLAVVDTSFPRILDKYFSRNCK
jgi:hypothetical protein